MLLNGYAGYSTLDSLPETWMARFLTEVLRNWAAAGRKKSDTLFSREGARKPPASGWSFLWKLQSFAQTRDNYVV
jgi:hypothetical protein